MIARVIRIEPLAPPKPAAGAACNGCGVCCLAEPCPLGMLLSRRRQGACVALDWDTGTRRYRCGAAVGVAGRLPPALKPMAPLVERLARRWISAGSGCDSTLETDPITPR
jgi:hypothetical protein